MQQKISSVREGVYAGVTGPTFESRAEYKLLHMAGADAVGMSTVQETIAAVHLGMDVFAMSIITDMGIREEENIITHEEVLDMRQTGRTTTDGHFQRTCGIHMNINVLSAIGPQGMVNFPSNSWMKRSGMKGLLVIITY